MHCMAVWRWWINLQKSFLSLPFLWLYLVGVFHAPFPLPRSVGRTHTNHTHRHSTFSAWWVYLCHCATVQWPQTTKTKQTNRSREKKNIITNIKLKWMVVEQRRQQPSVLLPRKNIKVWTFGKSIIITVFERFAYLKTEARASTLYVCVLWVVSNGHGRPTDGVDVRELKQLSTEWWHRQRHTNTSTIATQTKHIPKNERKLGGNVCYNALDSRHWRQMAASKISFLPFLFISFFCFVPERRMGPKTALPFGHMLIGHISFACHVFLSSLFEENEIFLCFCFCYFHSDFGRTANFLHEAIFCKVCLFVWRQFSNCSCGFVMEKFSYIIDADVGMRRCGSYSRTEVIKRRDELIFSCENVVLAFVCGRQKCLFKLRRFATARNSILSCMCSMAPI